jgi:ABC-type nitrate/sulfonate/bicarbonate transport system substrate-binding protein
VALQKHTSGKSALNAVKKGKADIATVAEAPIMHSGLKGEKIYVIATIEKQKS